MINPFKGWMGNHVSLQATDSATRRKTRRKTVILLVAELRLSLQGEALGGWMCPDVSRSSGSLGSHPLFPISLTFSDFLCSDHLESSCGIGVPVEVSHMSCNLPP